MRIAICDDNKFYCDDIEAKCRKYFERIGLDCEYEIFHSGEVLLESENVPDILFQDIELGSMNGIDVVKQLQQKNNRMTYVIYVTGYGYYMQDAFDYNVMGFMNKPANEHFLMRNLDRIMERKKELSIVHQIENQSIMVRDILCIKAQGAYSVMHLTDGTEVVERIELADWERRLKEYDFFRVHRSWLINMRSVKSYQRAENKVYMDNICIKIPLRRRNSFREAYTDFIFHRR